MYIPIVNNPESIQIKVHVDEIAYFVKHELAVFEDHLMALRLTEKGKGKILHIIENELHHLLHGNEDVILEG